MYKRQASLRTACLNGGAPARPAAEGSDEKRRDGADGRDEDPDRSNEPEFAREALGYEEPLDAAADGRRERVPCFTSSNERIFVCLAKRIAPLLCIVVRCWCV